MDSTDQSKLINDNIEKRKILNELTNTCTKIKMDYNARILLQEKYPFYTTDLKNEMFQDYLLDEYPLILLQKQLNSCDK